MNGLLIGATASNSGKTTAAIALAAALEARGFRVCAAKTGPDFLDSAWLAAFTHAPVANLDLWMCQNPHSLNCLVDRMLNYGDQSKPPFLLIEGAMGLYDGAANGKASCAEVAERLGLPILLLLNVKGMSQSCAALAEGFLNFRAEWMANPGKPRFCGLVCTHAGGISHQSLLRQALAPPMRATGIDFLGFLPANNAPALPSRHLGLAQACEVAARFEPEFLRSWFEENCNLDALLASSQLPEITYPPHAEAGGCAFPAFFFPPARTITKSGPVVAIAHDEAFAFCYADLPAMLADMGAEIKIFSPLHDRHIPACDAVYIPGGYPELYARQLADNENLRGELRSLARAGMPIYGECGGYIYLGRTLLCSDGVEYPMTGILPQSFCMKQNLAALGYREVYNIANWPAKHAIRCRGHEFHYAMIASAPDQGQILWQAARSSGGEYSEGCRVGNAAGSWIHLYPEGSRQFWSAWLNLATRQ